jgi:hypothetical protein
MAIIDNITDLAQDTYYTINGTENDDTGGDLVIFQNNFIRAFNLWRDEYEQEAYWNVARDNDYTLATIADATTYSFALPSTYRTPVFNENQELKFISDGTVIARFKMVDPNQRQVDDSYDRPDRAGFMPDGPSGGGTIVLSRPPTEAESGATIVLDVVRKFPKLTRDDDSVLNYVYNYQIAVLGIAKNETLADLTKVSLSPSFAQKYANELNKALSTNMASNEIDDMRGENYSYIGGTW